MTFIIPLHWHHTIALWHKSAATRLLVHQLTGTDTIKHRRTGPSVIDRIPSQRDSYTISDSMPWHYMKYWITLSWGPMYSPQTWSLWGCRIHFCIGMTFPETLTKQLGNRSKFQLTITILCWNNTIFKTNTSFTFRKLHWHRSWYFSELTLLGIAMQDLCQPWFR